MLIDVGGEEGWHAHLQSVGVGVVGVVVLAVDVSRGRRGRDLDHTPHFFSEWGCRGGGGAEGQLGGGREVLAVGGVNYFIYLIKYVIVMNGGYVLNSSLLWMVVMFRF